MTPASVGFQCPECLREGSRSVRQPRSVRLGGGAPVVTWTIIAINVAVFLLVRASPASLLFDLMQHTRSFCLLDGGEYPFGSADCVQHGGSFSRGVLDGGYWELLTSVFTHQEYWHIGSNMISLFLIGPMLEGALGRLRFTVTYLLCGLGGSALSYWAEGQYVSGLGASGAIFGLMGVLLVLFLRRGLPIQQILVVLALNFYFTFRPGSGISWQAHVGGFLTGLVIGAIIELSRGARGGEQLRWSGFGAVAVAIAVAVVARSLTL